ncbi:hypothetical protein [Actinoplanes flavus]|uniref:HEAT repeat domain-containing protein n=1 Tax=Actinoplanes flavus TaxID=2820290 RepID=A0ABS3UXC5_9ACTN|nr:hypothetical protein [Actinoplanes flavus]MBO3743217.1 hypothetical protein [Actinoplanes flavus]
MPSDPLDLDWSAVSHAFGPATDVPGLLRALRSPEEQRRTGAIREFRAKVLHQGSLYSAGVAAVPYLIELLADANAPDRTLGHELLAAIMPEEELGRLSGVRPHRHGPRLHELAEQRSDAYLARLEDEPHGEYGRPEIDPVHRQAYEAIRAGVPTYLRLLDDADRDARGLSAHLLSFFPESAPRVVPAIIARLAVEPDGAVGSLLCLAAGMIGDPGDARLVAAVTRWRDQPHRITRWTVLMGLVRLVEIPDADMLEQLCDCLFHGPAELYGWTFHHENLSLAAYLALGDLPARSLPGLATMLLDRLAAGGDDASRFHYAMQLLLGLVFPDGPLPDGAAPSDLSAQQYAAAHAVLRSGLTENVFTSRQLRECNLPGDEDTLRGWCTAPPVAAEIG